MMSSIDDEIAAMQAKLRELRAARRATKRPAARRSYCQQPDSCVAGKRGGCRLCQAPAPEVRAKISAATKAALAAPEVRAKMSAATKAALAAPEVRAKMSAARKAAWAGKRLPLTDEQRKIYTKLRAIVGREAALIEAQRVA